MILKMQRCAILFVGRWASGGDGTVLRTSIVERAKSSKREADHFGVYSRQNKFLSKMTTEKHSNAIYGGEISRKNDY